MNPFPSIGIVGKSGDARAASTVTDLIGHLCRRRAEGVVERILLSSRNAGSIAPGDAQLADDAELSGTCQLIIAVGGDGTLLGAGRRFASAGIPILGINRGRLGFLTEIGPEQLVEAVDACLDGRAGIEDRLMLQATVVCRDQRLQPIEAVNDIVLRNRTSIRMLEFETWLDTELIGRHRADGMIVSTATGSTGYALSGGGPVLHPRLEAMLLVPICPHTLSNRPIVVPADQPLRLVPVNGPAGAALTVDGQVDRALEAGDWVEITPAKNRLRLVHPPGYSYFQLLRSKLGWGSGPVFREPDRV